MNNKELVLKIKQGDHIAFKFIFKSIYSHLLAYVTTFTHDQQEAKDIVQNSFIILWNKRKELLEDSSLKNYLFTVAYNLYINQYRKNKFKLKVFNELKLEALNNRIPHDKTIQEQRSKKLVALIDKLPPRCKQIILLNKRDGLKYKEIAKTLNISVKTVETQMRIAYQKIRDGFKNKTFYLFIAIKNLFLQHTKGKHFFPISVSKRAVSP